MNLKSNLFGIPILILLFNILFVISTWPMGELPSLGTHEFARWIFILKNPINALLVFLFVALLLVKYLKSRSFRLRGRLMPVLLIALGLLISWYFDANRIFRTLASPAFAAADNTNYPQDLIVVSVTRGNESHAYPLQYLAYHHLITDSFEGETLDVTYCVMVDTVSAFAHQAGLSLELVAARENNSVYRDRETGSWWQQATGISIAGDLQGAELIGVETERLSFSRWREKYPKGQIMLPEQEFEKVYNLFFPELWP